MDALEQPDLARSNRDYLRALYGVIKSSDAHVRSRFSPAQEVGNIGTEALLFQTGT